METLNRPISLTSLTSPPDNKYSECINHAQALLTHSQSYVRGKTFTLRTYRDYDGIYVELVRADNSEYRYVTDEINPLVNFLRKHYDELQDLHIHFDSI